MKDVARTLLQAMDAIGDAFYLLDKEWRFVFVNAEASRLMNRPAGSLVNKVVWDEFPPARDSIFGREMFRAVATGHAIEFTARYGPLKRWFDVRLHPTDGGLAVAFSDADLRIEVEQLRELEARLTANVLAGAGLPSLFAVAIEIVRGAAEWAVGEAWLARADGKWELAAIDIADDEQLRRFAAHSRTISLHATEGLPGAAISRGDMIDFQALGVAEGFVRHEAAREAGLVAGVALPIIDHGKALGVLVFLNRQPLADDSWWHLLAPISERVTELARRERGLTLVDQFFELSIEGLAIGDATGRLVRVNPALCEMLGTTEAELIASRFETMIHPDDLPHTLEALELVQAGQRVVEYENRVRHGAGGWRRITWSSRIDPVEGALHATARDVTEVRRREALEDVQRDVLESLARDDTLAAILAKVVTAIEVMAPGSRAAAMLVRDGAVWLGAAPSLPTAYSTALHGARIGPAAGSCGTAAWRDEMVIVTDIANDPLWAAYRDLADTCGLVACWSIPFHDASGTVIGTLAVYPPGPELPSVVELDGVTALARIAAIAVERRRVDDELHLLRSAVEHLNDVVMITESEPLDAPGPRIQFVNEAFERMTGYTRAEAIGQSPRMLHGPTTDPAALGRIKAALQSALPIREEVTNYSRTGEPYTVEVDIAPVINREGLVTHFVSIQRDVTERRSLEEQLRESQKLEAVGRLAGGVAHDFNNMLTAIQGFAELLMLDTTDAESREHVAEIIRSARRASDLTRKLLAFSRRQVLQPQVVDLSALVGELTPLLERLVGEAVIHDVQLAADPLPVLADPGQIEQALVNLVLNSRERCRMEGGSRSPRPPSQ